MQNQEYAYQKDWTNERKNPLLDFYAQYKKDFSTSSLDVMGGYSWQHFWHKEPFTEYHIGEFDADGNPVVIPGDAPSELYLESFFGRVNYNLLSKYLFTATVRTDGSSRFAKGHRWGLFPAAALAWRVNEESFLKEVDAVSNLKLRLGWGITGQQDIGQGDYPSVNRYQTSQGIAASYYRDGQWVMLIKPLSFTPTLTWEKTTTYNVGLDYGFINNRISGSIDWYHRKTVDLINSEVKTPSGANFSEFVVDNVGSLENNGIEYTLNLMPVVTKNWQWEVGFNMAYNKNKITELTYGDNTLAYREFENTGGDGGRPLKIHKVGHPAGMFFVYEQVYDEAGKPIEGLYADRNNDGQINEQDRYMYHNSTPDFIYGFTTRLSWKAWDFSIASHGNAGNYNYNGMDSNHAELSPARVYANEFLTNRYQSAFDVNFGMKQVQTDYYIQNASFFRIDNVTLGWAFNKSKSLPLSGRIYGSVQNPLVLTKYTGLDPEISGGIDNDFYPRPVSVIFGINVNF
jgi:iron complex outermembrane receptor protein